MVKSCITDNTAIIDRVIIHFVFLGDPKTAEDSPVLDKLREDLQNKRYLVENALGRPVPLVIEFRSAKTKKVAGASHVRKTYAYGNRTRASWIYLSYWASTAFTDSESVGANSS